MSTATVCDACGSDVRMTLHAFRVERQGEVAYTLGEPDGWDFCSKRCLAAWARPAPQTPAPSPSPT